MLNFNELSAAQSNLSKQREAEDCFRISLLLLNYFTLNYLHYSISIVTQKNYLVLSIQ